MSLCFATASTISHFDWLEELRVLVKKLVPPTQIVSFDFVGPADQITASYVQYHPTVECDSTVHHVITFDVLDNRLSLHGAGEYPRPILQEKVVNALRNLVDDYNFCVATPNLASLMKIGLDNFREVCQLSEAFELSDQVFLYPVGLDQDEVSFCGATLMRLNTKDLTPAHLRVAVEARILALRCLSRGQVAQAAHLMGFKEVYALVEDREMANYVYETKRFLDQALALQIELQHCHQ